MRALLFLSFLTSIACGGTPQQAASVRTAYETSLEAWALKMQLAKTDAERGALERPSPKVAADRMWSVIQGDLAQKWAIEPAAWFVRLAAPLKEMDEAGTVRPLYRPEIAKVEQAVASHHLQSPDLTPMCMALVAAGDQQALGMLRKIQKENPDKKVAGVAALGIAMMAKGLGDEGHVMRERLTMLRMAIIDAADVKIDRTTVADLAKEELYIIRHLSKGNVAPDLEGTDSGGRSMKLSDFGDKVVMLVFWNSKQGGEDSLLRWVSALRRDERFKGKAFEVVGVNSDPREKLRDMQSNQLVDWPNFSDPLNELGQVYRVGSWPLAYVLGPDRKIHYFGAVGTFAEVTAVAVLSE
ncbi:peroxiredoxin [Haloferula luteola]|uniref:Peroxiredoxin n=1 Tax=Haloferula luteola TaxID=595692 RepID=A0A840UY78_9BACT|nr:redoxin domain-containing protein [Haloferula luteola]MBB5349923.1 peroxiredoxin [Haloferula luteola]